MTDGYGSIFMCSLVTDICPRFTDGQMYSDNVNSNFDKDVHVADSFHKFKQLAIRKCSAFHFDH